MAQRGSLTGRARRRTTSTAIILFFGLIRVGAPSMLDRPTIRAVVEPALPPLIRATGVAAGTVQAKAWRSTVRSERAVVRGASVDVLGRQADLGIGFSVRSIPPHRLVVTTGEQRTSARAASVGAVTIGASQWVSKSMSKVGRCFHLVAAFSMVGIHWKSPGEPGQLVLDQIVCCCAVFDVVDARLRSQHRRLQNHRRPWQNWTPRSEALIRLP